MTRSALLFGSAATVVLVVVALTALAAPALAFVDIGPNAPNGTLYTGDSTAGFVLSTIGN